MTSFIVVVVVVHTDSRLCNGVLGAPGFDGSQVDPSLLLQMLTLAGRRPLRLCNIKDSLECCTSSCLQSDYTASLKRISSLVSGEGFESNQTFLQLVNACT